MRPAMNGFSPIPPTSKRLSAEAGLTLVELVMVMVIVGILAAAVAPRFYDADVFKSRGFADQVQATLRYAQKVAIAQRRNVCVAFPTANSVTLTYDPCPGGSVLLSPSGDSYPISSVSATHSATPAETFYFNALGKPSSSVNQTITISNVASSIVVEAETGYVHLQ